MSEKFCGQCEHFITIGGKHSIETKMKGGRVIFMNMQGFCGYGPIPAWAHESYDTSESVWINTYFDIECPCFKERT